MPNSSDSNDAQVPPETTWPGVHLAYDLARESYSVVAQRLDAVNARIQALLGFLATITLGAPIVVRSLDDHADFTSVWFVSAIVLSLATSLAGIVTISAGSITTIAPGTLYQKWLSYGDWEFKKNLVYWAGEHFDKNSRLVNTKGWITVALTVTFLLETGCLLVWALTEV